MARYNTVAGTGIQNTTSTLSTPNQGLLTTLTGTAPYTVTVADPRLFSGITQTFYNSTSGTITLSTPAGTFVGPSTGGATTFAIPTGTVVGFTSDGVNYVLVDQEGGVLVATSGTFSGTLTANSNVTFNPASGTISIAPTTTGTINNMTIGNVTRAAGNFTSLNANSGATSSGTGSGAVIVTGGVGVSENINAGGYIATSASSYVLVAKGNTSQRPTGVSGYVRYNTDQNYLETYNGTSWVPGGGAGFKHVDVTSGYSASSWDFCWVNTSSIPITVTLPGSPVKGDTIRFADVARTFSARNLTISRNGQLIQGDGADMTVNLDGASFDLIYYNSTYGWRIFSV
jgi:hypothetical protein